MDIRHSTFIALNNTLTINSIRHSIINNYEIWVVLDDGRENLFTFRWVMNMDFSITDFNLSTRNLDSTE
jgi:hypothetical protein